jgi:hypothetical protein
MFRKLVLDLSPPHLRTETDPISEAFHSRFLEYRMMDKVQKLLNS